MNDEPTTVVCHIRPMIRRDMQEVFDISDFSFTQPWHPWEFEGTLCERNTLGWVAEGLDNRVVGYLIYRFEPQHLVVLNMAVHPRERRLGVGSAMIQRLQRKLTQPHGYAMTNRTGIIAEVSEVDMETLVFFQANKFSATALLRDCFEVDGVSRDGYRMEWER